MDWFRSQIAKVTESALYRRRVHQLRALGWMVMSAVGQVLAANNVDEIATWSSRRWVLGIGAVLVPAWLLSMKAGEYNPVLAPPAGAAEPPPGILLEKPGASPAPPDTPKTS